jgi:hypothetical protein
MAMAPEPALRAYHRFAGPIAGMLAESREGVKNGAFPYIWIAGKQNDLGRIHGFTASRSGIFIFRIALNKFNADF